MQYVKERASKHTSHVVRKIRTGLYTKIVFLVGAGISVDAGFPVFRGDGCDSVASSLSKDTPSFRIHDTLALFAEIECEPTDFHKLMHKHASRIYTQNIDGLEVDDGRTVWCHGKLSDGATCTNCGKVISWDEYKGIISNVYVSCSSCDGDLRPNIILYGDEVTFDFKQAKLDISNADLVVCAGTSLSVFPFADLMNSVVGDLLIVEKNVTPSHTDHLSKDGRYLYIGDCQDFARECASI